MENNTTYEIDQELLTGFIDEAQEGLASLDNLFIKLETDPCSIDTINVIFRPIHTIKGNSAFFGLMKLKKLAHEMESLLTLAKEGKLLLNESVISVLLAGTDKLKEILSRARKGEGEISDEAVFEDLVAKIIAARESKKDLLELWDDLFDKFEKIKTDFENLDSDYAKKLEAVVDIAVKLKKGDAPLNNQPKAAAASMQNTPTPPPPKPSQPIIVQEAAKTMRVAEETIDNFLGYVGELIVVGKMYDYLQKNIAEKNSKVNFVKDFKHVNETFDMLSANLQKSIMEIRKVPVRTILQKAPRMVHDIAVATGKEIKVVLVGEGIEIDKRLVEILDGPLTHMVRNAADHGVETTAERLAAGKERDGTIRIAVSDTKDDVSLTISDDGKGINLDAIKAKGVKLGIIKPDQKLTQEQIADLIFISGVSTAQKVTDVSGRGVGMDVVRRNIDTANGKIIINTQHGKGTEFIIRLPKTVSTQIIDGFLVKVAANSYVIPMDKVREVFRPQPNEISTVKETNQCVLRHDELLPVIKLEHVFGGSNDDTGDENKIMVSTTVLKRKIAFCVDRALGVQKVVLKEFGKLDLKSEFYTAAAVMGNGNVAMVLDLDRIAGFAVKE